MPSPDPPPKTSRVWQDAMDQDLRDIGDRVRTARKAAGLSQTRLAGLMDVATNTIGGLESGRRAVPVPLLKLVALHLALDPRELLGGSPLALSE